MQKKIKLDQTKGTRAEKNKVQLMQNPLSKVWPGTRTRGAVFLVLQASACIGGEWDAKTAGLAFSSLRQVVKPVRAPASFPEVSHWAGFKTVDDVRGVFPGDLKASQATEPAGSPLISACLESCCVHFLPKTLCTQLRP